MAGLDYVGPVSLAGSAYRIAFLERLAEKKSFHRNSPYSICNTAVSSFLCITLEVQLINEVMLPFRRFIFGQTSEASNVYTSTIKEISVC